MVLCLFHWICHCLSHVVQMLFTIYQSMPECCVDFAGMDIFWGIRALNPWNGIEQYTVINDIPIS